MVSGEHNLLVESGVEQISNVDSYLMHPEYSPTTLENDIALIYVRQTNITQVSHMPVCYKILRISQCHFLSMYLSSLIGYGTLIFTFF